MNVNILLQIIPGTKRKITLGISEKVLINMQNLLNRCPTSRAQYYPLMGLL
jgi:hypothetical protein